MNKLEATNYALELKTFGSGLTSYTQSNCQCSLTDDGYRIYRTPNVNPTNNGNTMWGGLVIKPFNIDSNFFVDGHSYVILFDVKGKSSNALPDIWWSNQVGWGGGGLGPQPTNVVVHNPVSANFNTEIWQTVMYKWDLTDGVRKVCTTSYSSFSAGTTYISYRDFKFGFQYTDTGTMGTELYVKNIRLYDITNMKNMDIRKTGVAEYISMIENENRNGTAAAYRFGEIRGNILYEI